MTLILNATWKIGIDTDNVSNNVLVFETKCGPKYHRILSIYEAGAINKVFFVCVLLCGAFFSFHIFFLTLSYTFLTY